MKETLKLQPEVAEKYNLTGVPVGIRHFEGFGKIDLMEVDLKRADALVLRGFPFLVAKETPKSKNTAVAPVKNQGGENGTQSAGENA